MVFLMKASLSINHYLLYIFYFCAIGLVLDSPGRHYPIRAAATWGDSEEQEHGHGVQEDNRCLNLHKLITALYGLWTSEIASTLL